MRKLFLSAPIIGLLLSARPCAAEAPVTLRQCYEWAQGRSESLKSKQEDIAQSKERGRAALGGVFPKVAWEAVDIWQDPAAVNKLNSAGFSGFIEKEQPESRFSLRQSLFSGFKELSAYKGFQREGARDSLRLQRALRELFERTVVAFYSVLGQEMEQSNTRASLELAQGRVKDLKGFLRLGKARQSEVFTAEAHAAALKAALRQTEARIASAREDLSFLTGQDLAKAFLLDELSDHPASASLDDCLLRAKDRADIRAQREDVSANEMRVRYEKGSYWPSLDLLGKYYTRRSTFLKDIRWDATLALEIPLFEGGRTSANVRRATSAYRQSLLGREELERAVAHSVRKTYGDLASAIEEVQSQEEAAVASKKSYDALLEEYRLGLVTNLDVLQALDFLQAQSNARDSARLKAKMLYFQLGVATETLP